MTRSVSIIFLFFTGYQNERNIPAQYKVLSELKRVSMLVNYFYNFIDLKKIGF